MKINNFNKTGSDKVKELNSYLKENHGVKVSGFHPKAKLEKVREQAEAHVITLRNYQDAVHKHLNDIFFYKHTMKTTKDNVLFYATEARVDMSLMKLRHCREELHNKLEINSLHGIHLVK